jgi:hypothetical protein
MTVEGGTPPKNAAIVEWNSVDDAMEIESLDEPRAPA